MELPSELRGKLTIDVTTAADVLGVSTATIYDSVARNELPSVRLGRKILIPVVPLLALVGISETEMEAMDEAVPDGSRKRRRLSPAHLANVAYTYRTAWESGSNPTQAVADYFSAPYSTASRWVMEARKSGQLGPADGSRGGERAEE